MSTISKTNCVHQESLIIFSREQRARKKQEETIENDHSESIKVKIRIQSSIRWSEIIRFQELLTQEDTLRFDMSMKMLSIVRYICDNLQKYFYILKFFFVLRKIFACLDCQWV